MDFFFIWDCMKPVQDFQPTVPPYLMTVHSAVLTQVSALFKQSWKKNGIYEHCIVAVPQGQADFGRIGMSLNQGGASESAQDY